MSSNATTSALKHAAYVVTIGAGARGNEFYVVIQDSSTILRRLVTPQVGRFPQEGIGWAGSLAVYAEEPDEYPPGERNARRSSRAQHNTNTPTQHTDN